MAGAIVQPKGSKKMKITLNKRIIAGVMSGYTTTINGTTYNVVKHTQGGWKVIECGVKHLPSVRTLADAKDAIASNEGL